MGQCELERYHSKYCKSPANRIAHTSYVQDSCLSLLVLWTGRHLWPPLLCFLSGRGTRPAFPASLDLLEETTSALTAPARPAATLTGPKPMVSLLRAPLLCALLGQFKFQPVDVFSVLDNLLIIPGFTVLQKNP